MFAGVSPRPLPLRTRGDARRRLLDAATAVIRTKGLSATSVDDLCRAAGVTKGAFFHHFPTKEALAVAAADHWSQTTGAMFEADGYHDAPSAAERVLGYVDLRERIADGPLPEVTCLVGTMTQEAYVSKPDVRDACAASIFGHAATLEADLSEALEASGSDLDAASVARFTQVVLQGSFVLAKAADDPALITEALAHLRRYLAHELAAAER